MSENIKNLERMIQEEAKKNIFLHQQYKQLVSQPDEADPGLEADKKADALRAQIEEPKRKQQKIKKRREELENS